MKKLVFGLIATVMFGFVGNSQSLFEESVALITSNRVSPKDGNLEESARSFIIKIFDKSYKIENSYVIDNVDYTDDGNYNDLKSNDGVYTSVVLISNLKNEVNTNSAFVSESFKYRQELENAGKFMIKCKMRMTHSGTTILGFSCESGCILLYDCTVDFGW